MPKCTYCGKMYDSHRGLTLVGTDGSINYLCSKKCRRSREMKKRKVRWITKAKRKTKKELQKEVLARSEEAAEHSADMPQKEKNQDSSKEKKGEKKEEKN